jgi:hypothetical protein
MRTPVSFENNGRAKPQRKMRDCEWTLLHANAEQHEQDFTTPTTPGESVAAIWEQSLRLRGLKPTAKIGRGSATPRSPASVQHANDQGNPAAAKSLCFQNPPDPPLGLSALLGRLWARDRSTAKPSCGIVANLLGKCNQFSDPTQEDKQTNPAAHASHQQRIHSAAITFALWHPFDQ